MGFSNNLLARLIPPNYCLKIPLSRATSSTMVVAFICLAIACNHCFCGVFQVWLASIFSRALSTLVSKSTNASPMAAWRIKPIMRRLFLRFSLLALRYIGLVLWIFFSSSNANSFKLWRVNYHGPWIIVWIATKRLLLALIKSLNALR